MSWVAGVGRSRRCSRGDQSQRAGSTDAAGAVLAHVSKMFFKTHWVEPYRIAVSWVTGVSRSCGCSWSYQDQRSCSANAAGTILSHVSKVFLEGSLNASVPGSYALDCRRRS